MARSGLHTPGLAEHLWQTTLDKLAVDQPGYDSYRRESAAGHTFRRGMSMRTGVFNFLAQDRVHFGVSAAEGISAEAGAARRDGASSSSPAAR